MELSSKYNPEEIESKWYQYWLDNGFFRSTPDEREPYTIVIPPPNVTGVLHMGHMLNNTIQDVLVRRARMQGKNACWVPGTDHASIATEAKVVAKLASEGIQKSDLTREEFLAHAWDWTHKHGGIILEQLKKLGASCDWERTCFTMDEKRSQSVIKVFCDLYEKGKIYRGVRMVNWDPQALTALSDEEVNHKEVQGKMYYLKYKIISPLTPKGGTDASGYQTANPMTYHLLKELAAESKNKSTETESIMWEYLSGKKLDGYKFHRQHIINEFIVDFVCLKENLIVEIDGGYHNKPEIQEADKLRTEILESLGYRVIRFTNEEVLRNIDGVLNGILAALNAPPSGAGGLFAVVATTRPETIFGDTAMCINPNNPKTAHLKGKRVIVPLINREIPVIEDEYVDVEFGTGCLKVTPAHDVNDYILGEKYNLPSIDIFNDNGTLNNNGAMYAGMDRFTVKKQIEKDLEAAGLLEKVEPYTNKVGFSERTDVPIEPKLSMQWFLKMEELAKPALENVENDTIKFYPAKFKNTYRHWMENIKDWCISRQLWWGHQIPAWYIEAPLPPEGGNWGYVVAPTEEEARKKALAKFPSLGGVRGGFSLRQDDDCLDTWFSSWLWPISVFDGINNPDNNEINYYYPTNDLVTAPEIIFFWVARMIMAGYEYRREECFKNVYFTGIVRDKLGRKMSKSLGNSPEPLELIAKYGADGVRMGMLLSSPAGNDLPFDESLCETGRNFNNKIWNSLRLVKGWEVEEKDKMPVENDLALAWFSALLKKTILEVDDLFSKYRLSEALTLIYKLFWDEFSAWLLEIIKPEYGDPIDKTTRELTIFFFNELLKTLHPFMPFITEELYQTLANSGESGSIMNESLAKFEFTADDESFIKNFDTAKDIISNIRNVRASKQISPKEKLTLQVNGEHNTEYNAIIEKLANVAVEYLRPENEGGKHCTPTVATSFMVGTTEYAIPLGNLINAEEEIAKMETEIKYLEGFLKSVGAKLSNEKFVANAKPEIVENERKKQADAESKIVSLKENIVGLKK
jgi:valyl-tRNA synthetase